MLEEYCKACGIEADAEVLEIDRMEDSIAPLDDDMAKIRQLISSIELCYHEADKEAEYIAQAIGAGQSPPRSDERPPQRKKELEDCRQILSSWCENPSVSGINLELGGISAGELLNSIGSPTPLKLWQVKRIVDKVTQALDPSRPFHNIVLDLGHYGEPGANPVGDYYKDNLDFVKKTIDTVIHDTINGQKAKITCNGYRYAGAV